VERDVTCESSRYAFFFIYMVQSLCKLQEVLYLENRTLKLVARWKAAGMLFAIFERRDTKFTEVTRIFVIGE